MNSTMAITEYHTAIKKNYSIMQNLEESLKHTEKTKFITFHFNKTKSNLRCDKSK